MAVNKVQYGNTTLIDLSQDTVASAADIVSGKVGHLRDGSVVTGTGGGGGASNLVKGTFKGTTAGAAMDVDLNYTGTGYPIAVIVYPTGGFKGNQTFVSLLERYSIAIWTATKHNMTNAPSYTSENIDSQNSYFISYHYKSSSTSASNYSSTTSAAQTTASNSAATNAGGTVLKLRSAKKMSVYIHGSSNYGFAANIEYTYQIIYSS